MAAKDLLQVLLQVSEKSAQIARAWRCQEELFELMVEEKTEKEKNQRFVRDFKTLADVLVQEVVNHYVIQKVSSAEPVVLNRRVFLTFHTSFFSFIHPYSFLSSVVIFSARNQTYSPTALARKLE